MKYPKFRRDDLVQTQMGTKARVLSFRVQTGEHYYTIEFLDGARKGDIVEFKDDYISFYNTNKLNEDDITVPNRCPVCNTKWKVTGFGMKKWYDCSKCNDTAENLIKQCKTDMYHNYIHNPDFIVKNYIVDNVGNIKYRYGYSPLVDLLVEGEEDDN